MLEDRPFSEQMQEVLDIKFFESKYLQVFSGLIFDYREKYNVHPSDEILDSILRTEMEDEPDLIKKQVRDFFTRIRTKDIEDSQYVKDTSLDFCKKQKLKEAMMISVGLLDNCSFEEIKKVIDEAVKLGVDNDHGHDYKKDFELRYIFKARNPVSTGWDRIDKITKGGLGKGELGVVVAPTGAGKSHALVHLGATAVRQGKTVAHYTLELSEEVVGQRYDSCITRYPLSGLNAFKDKIKETCLEVKGELFIKEYPTKSASTNTIRASLDKLLKREKKVDLIIIDYADILKPTTNYKEKRNQLESIYEELRGIAKEYECPIWTASQTNRTGLNQAVITMEAISEAFNKCFVSDFICTISRTKEDKTANTGKMYVAKNRNGPDGMVFPLLFDTSNVKIEVLEPTDETIDEMEVSEVKRQQREMKKVYTQWEERNK
tara:strand:- start:560 stop:1858 length:1299 start_codon:yes stop_codon:yes gene_type:complete